MTDLNAGTKKCSNCLQDINLANFVIHESFCFRNIAPCDICKKPVDKNKKQEHFDEFHAKEKCECGELIEKMYLDAHKAETCRKRQAKCFYCDLSLDFEKIQEHMDFCGSRTEQCDKCKRYIQIKDRNKHDMTSCSYPTIVNNNSTTNARRPFRTVETEPPISFDFYRPRRATSFQSNLAKTDLNDDQKSFSLLPCEFCNEFYTPDELIQHQSICDLNTQSSGTRFDPIHSYQNDSIPSFLLDSDATTLYNAMNRNDDFFSNPFRNDLNDFGRLNLTNRRNDPLLDLVKRETRNLPDENTEMIPCEFCQKLINIDSIVVHQSGCQGSGNDMNSLLGLVNEYDETSRNSNSGKTTSSTRQLFPKSSSSIRDNTRSSNSMLNRIKSEDFSSRNGTNSAIKESSSFLDHLSGTASNFKSTTSNSSSAIKPPTGVPFKLKNPETSIPKPPTVNPRPSASSSSYSTTSQTRSRSKSNSRKPNSNPFAVKKG